MSFLWFGGLLALISCDISLCLPVSLPITWQQLMYVPLSNMNEQNIRT